MTKSPFSDARCLPLRALDCFRPSRRERNAKIIGEYIWNDEATQQNLARKHGMTQAQVSYIVRKYSRRFEELMREENTLRAWRQTNGS